MGFIKHGVGEILPDSVIDALKRTFASWTRTDQQELEAEIEASDEDE